MKRYVSGIIEGISETFGGIAGTICWWNYRSNVESLLQPYIGSAPMNVILIFSLISMGYGFGSLYRSYRGKNE